MSKTVKQGIIYMIQPAELVGTNRYKIGCSSKITLDRVIKGYKKGTRYLHISECAYPYALEKKIKDSFNSNFNLIAGKEYFQGDEFIMKEQFYSILNQHTIETTSPATNDMIGRAKDDADNNTTTTDTTYCCCFRC